MLHFIINKLKFILTIFVISIEFKMAQYINQTLSEYQIFDSITEDYNSKIRPSPKVDIRISMSLKQIMTIDEKNQIMTSSSSLSLQWKDARLAWPSSDFNNVSEILVPTSKLWTPDMFVINTADNRGYIPIASQSLALIQDDGWIYVVFSLANLKTRCDMKIKAYPFDTQTCSVNWFR
jgi:nicotinic acetylcholine receptor beta-4